MKQTKLDPAIFWDAAARVVSRQEDCEFACWAIEFAVTGARFVKDNITDLPRAEALREKRNRHVAYFTRLFKTAQMKREGREVWWCLSGPFEEQEHYNRKEARCMALQLTAMILEEEQSK